MHWKTLIVTPDNWVVGEHTVKNVMIWAIQDRPWLHIRTYNVQIPSVPAQLKTNSWTDVVINSGAECPPEVLAESKILGFRMNFFNELNYRLTVCMENLGISDPTSNLIDLHEYLVSTGVIPGEAPVDAKINYENKMRLLQDLNKIKVTVIDAILTAKNADDFSKARVTMERLFFTNILL